MKKTKEQIKAETRKRKAAESVAEQLLEMTTGELADMVLEDSSFADMLAQSEEEMKSPYEQLEAKACKVDKLRAEFEHFNDLGDVLSPSEYNRIEKATHAVTERLVELLKELNDIQYKIGRETGECEEE